MSLVEQLQAEALRADADLPNLLHRALVVSTKLNLTKFNTWVRLELDGYPIGVEVPHYRSLCGKLSYHNPFHGTQRAFLDDPEFERRLTSAPMRDSIAKIGHLLQGNRDCILCHFPPPTQQLLMHLFQLDCDFYLTVSTHHLKGILDSVKTELLAWTLRLEQDGILGEGMGFSDTEKSKVKEERLTPSFVINIIGKMDKSQLQQFSPSASQTG